MHDKNDEKDTSQTKRSFFAHLLLHDVRNFIDELLHARRGDQISTLTFCFHIAGQLLFYVRYTAQMKKLKRPTKNEYD